MSTIEALPTRAASALSASSTWNEETREIDVIWAAGADVRRYDWSEGGYYVERLAMTADAADLSRMNNGASLLDSHNAYSMDARLGVVVAGSAKIVGGLGVARVKLLRNAGGEALADACRQGAGFLLSVGYRTEAYERTEGAGNELPILTATRWTPMEISAVPIPADPAARTRGITSHMRTEMDPDDLTEVPPMTRSQLPLSPQRPAIPPAVLAERERVNTLIGLRSLRPDDISAETLTRAISNGISVTNFRAQLLDAIVMRQEQAATFPHAPAPGAEARAHRQNDFQAQLVEVLAGRASNGGAIAREYLEAQGVRTGIMSDREIAQTLSGGSGSVWGGQRAMHSSNDFVLLVGASAAAVLLERFKANPSVLKRFSRHRNAPDFRDVNFYRLGEAPPLLKVNEHGEIKSGTLKEESNGFRIETYARMFSLTFQASVNDGLGAFSDFLGMFAESATQLEGDLFALLLDGFGPRLDDGLPLFHADHGNLAAVGAPPTIETVNEGVISMRTQRNVNGHGYAGTAPTAILVGPRLELPTKQLVAEIQATDAASVNPHRLEVVVEDRFGREFEGWFLLADPARRPAFIHGGLESEGEAPQVDSKPGWKVLGTEYRVVHHFGAGAYDHRAIYFNEGK